ncbi:uncharacterized protein [Neodiprion pinetum]|uniref:Uncharacterized protein LOC124292798 isoform X2 n=1 Tax=Neodiprion lecontei TaxID=441921 RepID=A0ABM3FFC4_NEOLC|nr:uncharacterized protein LOC124292798 isoform X2 [Neodiprion lecontei]
MPECFKPQYSNTRVIIDCTEFKIDVPSSVDDRIYCYSHYKKGFTAKILIGITPSGFICFKSKVAGGRKDAEFATRLLNKALNEQPQASTSVDLTDENLQFSEADTDQFIDQEFLTTEDTVYSNSETQESEASLYRWSTPCVLLLLESYRALEKDFYSGKISQKKIWEKVAKELKVKGHDVTGPQCSSKLRSLKKTYKSIKDHNNKSGNDRRTWQFFDNQRRHQLPLY